MIDDNENETENEKQSQRCDTHRSRPRQRKNILNIKCCNIMMVMIIAQHLSIMIKLNSRKKLSKAACV